jgi:hypothetical protein
MDLKTIDVAKVIAVEYPKRLFSLFDRERPFTLTVTYYSPQTQTGIAPVLGGRGGFAVYNETVTEHYITKRYRSEKLVKHEITEIKSKMKKLDHYQQLIREQL